MNACQQGGSSAALTAVLVHGAFCDASSWSGVVVELQSAGIAVLAPPNPLRSINGDAAYIAERVRQIDGPALLVGHSYGGAVITVAAAAARNVVGLFYVAAFIPDEGEVLAEIAASFPQQPLFDVLRHNAFPVDGEGETAVELSIAPEEYPSFFLPGLPPQAAAAAAVSQRPLAASALFRGSWTARGDGLRARARDQSHPPGHTRAPPARLITPSRRCCLGVDGRRRQARVQRTGRQPRAIPAVTGMPRMRAA